MDFGIYLVRRGMITADEYVDAREEMSKGRHKFGELALTSHKLTMRQVLSILDAQVDTPMPFGQLAVEKGYLTPADVTELLELQDKLCPSISAVLARRHVLDDHTLQAEKRRFHFDLVDESTVIQHA